MIETFSNYDWDLLKLRMRIVHAMICIFESFSNYVWDFLQLWLRLSQNMIETLSSYRCEWDFLQLWMSFSQARDENFFCAMTCMIEIFSSYVWMTPSPAMNETFSSDGWDFLQRWSRLSKRYSQKLVPWLSVMHRCTSNRIKTRTWKPRKTTITQKTYWFKPERRDDWYPIPKKIVTTVIGQSKSNINIIIIIVILYMEISQKNTILYTKRMKKKREKNIKHLKGTIKLTFQNVTVQNVTFCLKLTLHFSSIPYNMLGETGFVEQSLAVINIKFHPSILLEYSRTATV